MIRYILTIAAMVAFSLLNVSAAVANPVRLKDLGRFDGWRDNPVVGYGIVTGLSSSGDSPRSQVTKIALKNALARLGMEIDSSQIQSRNVAVVMVTATLPPSANVGDRLDVTVNSIGDARSLAGGTLLMTPLKGPDGQVYALAQGPLVIGAYSFQADQNVSQKNYPAAGTLPNGATVERSVSANLENIPGSIRYILRDPDFSTAEAVARSINFEFSAPIASVVSADLVSISTENWKAAINSLLVRIENVRVTPQSVSRIVINERTGTVVAGGNVTISDVVIAQGDIKVTVEIDNSASQPNIFGGFVRDGSGFVVTNTKLSVSEEKDIVYRAPGSTVADLVQGLSKAKVSTRTMIAILQAMKAAGAVHADIVVQ
ncbi:flagellar basal body P-ring protein FlgI [Sphingorhabdus arenilitoris]|uniref:Flagellar P-ring protein n=1 Tax=Sphingorhabdus arenilitoris TaxID=1490041 RepID=A0ABV8RCC7_9SPHN